MLQFTFHFKSSFELGWVLQSENRLGAGFSKIFDKYLKLSSPSPFSTSGIPFSN